MLPCLLHAQTLRGKVFQHGYDMKNTPLADVTVKNNAQNKYTISKADGAYQIDAVDGDTITFSISGFTTDTITVQSHQLLAGHDVLLLFKSDLMQRVVVTTSYEKDSLERRVYYNNIYNQAGITGRNTPEAGFGIVLSPASFFSKQSRRERALKKRLKQQEEEAYIDYVFSKSWVAGLTKLSGDELNLFYYTYRPTYEFARKHNHEDLTQYVNLKLVEYKKNKPRR